MYVTLYFACVCNGMNPALTPGCEFYLLLSEIQLHQAL